MPESDKSAANGQRSGLVKDLGRFLGLHDAKKPFTLSFTLHLNAHSKREIGSAYQKIVEGLKVMEKRKGGAAGMIRGMVTSLFGVTEDIDVIRVADSVVRSGYR